MAVKFEGKVPDFRDYEYVFKGLDAAPPGEILFTDEQIRARELELVIDAMGEYDFTDPNVICLCPLKGGIPFFLDATGLIEQMTGVEPKKAYIKTETYSEGRTVGEMRVVSDIDFDIKDALIVTWEDVSDTNTTGIGLNYHLLFERQALSHELISLVVKEVPDKVGPDPLRFGFRAPNRWLGGMGMDLGDKNDPDYGRAYRSIFAID